MTRNEYERQARQSAALTALGFSYVEAFNLRRISMTLRAWHEAECSGVERDPDTGRTYWRNSMTGRLSPHQDRETGALRRLAVIMAKHAPLVSYVQGDPRGAALYIVRPSDVPTGGDIEAYYSRGVCVA